MWNISCSDRLSKLFSRFEMAIMSKINNISLRWQTVRTFFSSPIFIAFLLAHLVFILLLGVRSLGYLQSLELTAYDAMLIHQSNHKPVDDRITVLWLTDADQRKYGWPLSDRLLTELLQRLLENKARVIGLDLYRDMPVPLNDTEGNALLNQVFADNDNIIAIMKFTNVDGSYVPAPKILEKKRQVGFNDVIYDSGYIIRRGLLFMDDREGSWKEYFGLKLALRYLKDEGVYLRNDGKDMILGDTLLPAPLSGDFGGYVSNDASGYQFLFNYFNVHNPIKSLTLTQLFDNNFNPDLLRDKIIIIGTNAEATPDFFYTPVSRWLDGEQRMPGVSVHAHGTSHILRWGFGQDQALYSFNESEERIWIWVWTLLGALFCLKIHDFWRFAVFNSLGIAGLGLISLVAFHYHWWLLFVAPVFGWFGSMVFVMTYQAYKEHHERATLMNLFSRHVSKDVAKVIWASRDQYLNGGKLVSQRLTATVLFTDLQNFTTVSESMEPQELMDWLNEYMSVMVKVVEAHNGQVNKFIGDAVMAVFGVPIAAESEAAIAQSASDAVDCALSMRTELAHLRMAWEKRGMPKIRMRVGIFTGPLVAGSLGGEQRQEYTVLGDTVNTAARLESFDKTLDADNICRILIGDDTLNYLSERYQTESVGTVHLKGKVGLVAIHLVQGRYSELEQQLMQAESADLSMSAHAL